MSGGWKSLNLRTPDFARFDARYRQNYLKSDSVYDAYMLSESLTRDVFPYNKFEKLYPEWWSMYMTEYHDKSGVWELGNNIVDIRKYQNKKQKIEVEAVLASIVCTVADDIAVY